MASDDKAKDKEEEVEYAMSGIHPTEQTRDDALLYLSKVQHKFSDRPHIYNDLRDILTKFEAREVDTDDAINRVIKLFHCYSDLALGVNAFLPIGHQIDMRKHDEVKVTLRDVRDGSETKISLGRASPMSEVFKAYADVDAYCDHQEENGASKSNEYCFAWNGEKVNSNATPESLGLKDSDVVDVVDAQIPIFISLRDQIGREIMFKMKPTARLSKVVKAFANRYELSEDDIELCFKGVRISNYDESPFSLGMKNDDKIDVRLPPARLPLTIYLRQPEWRANIEAYKLNPLTRLSAAVARYVVRRGITASQIELSFGGAIIDINSTPIDVGLEDGDTLDIRAFGPNRIAGSD